MILKIFNQSKKYFIWQQYKWRFRIIFIIIILVVAFDSNKVGYITFIILCPQEQQWFNMWDYYTAASDSVDSKLIELELQHHKTGIKCWHMENLDEMFQSFLIFLFDTQGHDRSAEDAYSSLTSNFRRGPCLLSSCRVFVLWFFTLITTSYRNISIQRTKCYDLSNHCAGKVKYSLNCLNRYSKSNNGAQEGLQVRRFFLFYSLTKMNHLIKWR